MAEETTKTEVQAGPFQLGSTYEEVGPELGHLHEARHTGTGRPALVLVLGDGVEWVPDGEWRMTLSCRPGVSAMTLEVERAPDSARMTEVADLLVLMAAAVERVEGNARVLAHLASGRVWPWARWGWRAVAGLAVLALGLGLWSLGANPRAHRVPAASGGDSRDMLDTDAPDFINAAESPSPAVSYPLPSKPFRNQAKAPCKTQAGEVEIHGGCWMALEERPPCYATHAEYQGKCYMPVGKDRGELPQSVEP